MDKNEAKGDTIDYDSSPGWDLRRLEMQDSEEQGPDEVDKDLMKRVQHWYAGPRERQHPGRMDISAGTRNSREASRSKRTCPSSCDGGFWITPTRTLYF